MATRLVLPGRTRDAKPDIEREMQDELSDFLDVEVLKANKVDVRVRGTAAEETDPFDNAEDDDIVEIEFDNGARQWISVAQLREDLEKTSKKRGGARELAIPSSFRRERTTRGLFDDLGIKFVNLIRTRLGDELEDQVVGLAADKAALKIAEHFENKLNPDGPGLYHFSDPQLLTDKITNKKSLNNKEPYLLFLHGTASSTTGSFGQIGVLHSFDQLKLQDSPEWKSLKNRYTDRILGFEHRTFTESPIVNAIQLVDMLPAGARLHLVSHSRGGLVGEMLCLGQVPELGDPAQNKALIDLLSKPFAVKDRKDDIKALRELTALLVDKRLQIDKFLRVACPAAGTTLLTGRMDLYLSTILNLLGLIPWLKATPTYKFVKATLLELAKRRADPEVMPGIEAMLPTSPLVLMLNGLGIKTQSDLAVISGDIEGGDLIDRLKISLTDVYYSEQHDFVVNTKAMSRGIKRDKNSFIYFDQGAEINHFSYFKNHDTRSRVVNWLLSPTSDKEAANKVGFADLMPEAVERVASRAMRAVKTGDMPVVYVLPGIMGSHLQVGNDRIWIDPLSLAFGKFDKLSVGAKVTTDGVVSKAYQRLIDFLGSQYEVQPFPYDWRLSINKAAENLAISVDEQLKKSNRSIKFVAHSMGGLVMRAMIANHQSVWNDVCSRGTRVLMLGTPNNGSYVIPQLLAGREKLLKMLAIMDLQHDLDDLIAIIRKYPGLMEMLPEEMLDTKSWDKLKGVSKPDLGELKKARDVRSAIAGSVDMERMLYVAGTSSSTPCGVAAENGKLVFRGTSEGDGRVTYKLGLLEGVKTWFVDAEHGDLADHVPSFPAYVDLLEQGTTTRLSTAPTVRRGVPVEHALRDLEPETFPDANDLIEAALGAGVRRAQIGETHTLQVSITHGHLRNAKYPILVGHYKGDVITGAERVIDNQLDKQLSQLFQIGAYPGEDGTFEIFSGGKQGLKGAIVIGLGEMGDISPEKIRTGVTTAALKLALRTLNEGSNKTEDGWVSSGFSSLLLGTYSSSQINVYGSVSAILQGAVQANRALQAQGLWDKVRIDAVEILELYEDIATQAINSAARLIKRPPMEMTAGELLELIPPYLCETDGGMPQRPADQYSSGWWRRVKIAVDDKAKDLDPSERMLRFTVLSDRARAEEEEQMSQRKLVDSFISAAVDAYGYDEKLSSALFELMVPNVYKDQVTSQGNLVLVVDDQAANYPWELMAARSRSDLRPLACERGIIRQLVTSNYRPNPKAAQGNNIFIIGDPILNDPRFTQLAGAVQEAEMVSEVLEGRFEVTRRINSDPLDIVSALFEMDYRIIHLAGHGHYDPEHPVKSGMVLGDGMWLSSAEFKQLRIVPDLVFINCCHLGKIDEQQEQAAQNGERRQKFESNKLAASISQELIGMGVRAVVAAGWAVDDAAAVTFAEVFYKSMLDNETFGDAVLGARKKVFNNHRQTNTWGAYQCYGNPDFRLNQIAGGSRKWSSPPVPRSWREFRDQLVSIKEKASGADSDYLERLAQQLVEVERSLPPQWLDGEILGHLGNAWAALGDFDRGIECYERALGDEKGKITLWSLQQNANLLSRYAKKLSQDASFAKTRPKGRSRRSPSALLKNAESILKKVRQINETTELLSLFGSLYKNWAQIEPGQKVSKLKSSADSYKKSYEIALEKTGEPDPYPGINWLTCHFIADQLSAGRSKAGKAKAGQQQMVKDQTAKILESAQKSKQSDNIWKRVHYPDAQLFNFLINNKLTQKNADEVIESYNFAVKDRADQREIDSVKSQFDFIINMLRPVEKRIKPTIGRLERIRDSIKG